VVGCYFSGDDERLKLDRMMSILVVLLRKERVRARDLAEMFNVSVRTILRDVDAINLAGIPIVTYQGANGGIGIAEGYRLDKSLLTPDDLASIIAMLRGVAGTMPDTRHDILMEKLMNTQTAAGQNALDVKSRQLVIDLSPWGGDGSVRDKLDAVRGAVERCRVIEFVYVDPEGTRTHRRVEPCSVVLKGQKWYLYGFCRLRQDFRFFKLSRMRELTVLDEGFNPRDVPLEKPPEDNGWKGTDKTIQLELVFEEEMEGIIDEWFGDKMEKDRDGRIKVTMQAPENNWLYGFLLSFGPGVEVVRPIHVRAVLADIAQKIYNKYS
jgi:predicted DNA-binding transcriptional regulator YafY